MPLLPLEPSLHPPDLFSRPFDPAAGPECWWVLHARPRAEKALARRFLKRDLTFFLPLHEKQTRKAGRLFRSYLPLFPGYLFLRGDNQARIHALETNQLVRVLPVDDQLQLHNDLARVHHLIVSGAPLTPEDKLQPGMRVAIVSGPLAGLEGKVLKRGKQYRFFVEVQMLQRGVSVEIDAAMIQALDQA